MFRRSPVCVKCLDSPVSSKSSLREHVSFDNVFGACPLIIYLGVECDSSALVPGDIINLLEPPLTTVPADMFLLSGDAIVNESMLTGESVPVGKGPAKDEDLIRWKDGKDISGESSKSFLYAGTRIVRVRGTLTTDGNSGAPAIGLVARTGEVQDRY